jgi:hypothetical protein
MRWQGHAVSLLGPSLFSGENAAQTASKINEAWLTSLESCSFVLHRYRRQAVISDADMERIRSLIAELRATVEDELAPGDELRDFLLHHARAMARALTDYQIRGPAALEDAFDQTVGAVGRRRGDFESKGYTRREVWKKFGALVGAVAATLAIPATTVQLTGEVRSAIDGPSAPPVEKVIIDETTINETTIVPPQQAPAVSGSSSETTNGSRRATPQP